MSGSTMTIALFESNGPQPLCSCCNEPVDANCVTDSYDGVERVMCEDCDSDFTYCRYCDTRYSPPECRHLFWSDDWGDFGGCGYCEHDNTHDLYKQPVWRLLAFLGIDASEKLLWALRSHRYFHQVHGSTFSQEGLTVRWGDRDGRVHSYGRLLDGLFERDPDTEEMRQLVIAVEWLLSLWAGDECTGEDHGLAKTPDADDLTASWVQEWLSRYSGF
jgi:hypothetical protein